MFDRIKHRLSKFVKSTRAVSGGGVIGIIVAIMLVILLASYLLPDALEVFFAVNTTNWTTASGNMWDTLPTFSMLAIMLTVIGLAVYKIRSD